MSISSPFIRRPVATTLLNLSIVLAGAVAFMLLAVSPLPQVDFPVIIVFANLPGASPETMASSVATPLERALGTIAGVNMSIEVNDYEGKTVQTWSFDRAYPIKWSASDLNAGGSEFLTQSLEIAYTRMQIL